MNKSFREVLERLGATDALSLAYLEDGAYDDFVMEGAHEEARKDFELLMVAARESVKVRVAQPRSWPWITSTRSAGVRQNGAIQLESSVNGTMTVTVMGRPPMKMWVTFTSGSVSGATGPGGGRDIATAPLGK